MLESTERAVSSFRAHRLGLWGGGTETLADAAAAQVGAQAQIESCAVMGLSQRTAGRPSAETVRGSLKSGELVRTWGQRDTVHIYPPSLWPWVVAARSEWGKSGRRLDHAPEALVNDAAAHLETFDRPVSRQDFRSLVTESWTAQLDTRYFDTPDKRWRFCAGRLIWHLANRGELVHSHTEGSEAFYAARSLWFSELDFAAAETAPVDAAVHLADRYFAAYGPATVHDLAHFFGAKVTSARGWTERLALETLKVGDKELLARPEDLEELQRDRPLGVRLVAGYDNALMGYADKSWLVPRESDRKKIWRKAAVVAAIVWERGRAVATWKHKVRAKRVDITVSPLSAWSGTDLTEEAHAIAVHLGRPEATVTIEN